MKKASLTPKSPMLLQRSAFEKSTVQTILKSARNMPYNEPTTLGGVTMIDELSFVKNNLKSLKQQIDYVTININRIEVEIFRF
jgi:hypothetical protein